jgi:hypothetical protein
MWNAKFEMERACLDRGFSGGGPMKKVGARGADALPAVGNGDAILFGLLLRVSGG